MGWRAAGAEERTNPKYGPRAPCNETRVAWRAEIIAVAEAESGLALSRGRRTKADSCSDLR